MIANQTRVISAVIAAEVASRKAALSKDLADDDSERVPFPDVPQEGKVMFSSEGIFSRFVSALDLAVSPAVVALADPLLNQLRGALPNGQETRGVAPAGPTNPQAASHAASPERFLPNTNHQTTPQRTTPDVSRPVAPEQPVRPQAPVRPNAPFVIRQSNPPAFRPGRV